MTFYCSLCGDKTEPWTKETSYGLMHYNETCRLCRESYYNKNGVNRHGQRERYCIRCGLHFRKRTKKAKGREDRIEFCTSCYLCPDCKIETNTHDARRGRS